METFRGLISSEDIGNQIKEKEKLVGQVAHMGLEVDIYRGFRREILQEPES